MKSAQEVDAHFVWLQENRYRIHKNVYYQQNCTSEVRQPLLMCSY